MRLLLKIGGGNRGDRMVVAGRAKHSKAGARYRKRLDRFNRDQSEVFVDSRFRPTVWCAWVQSVRWSMRTGRAAEGGRNGEVPLAQPSAKEREKLR